MGGKLLFVPEGGEPVMTKSSVHGVTVGGATGLADNLRKLALLALFIFSRSALAEASWDAGPFLTPPATLLSVANSRPAPKSAVELLLEQYDYRIEESGAAAIRHRAVYRILDAPAAKAWSRLSVSWRPSWDARPTLDARVVSPYGTEHRLDPSTVAEGGDGVSDEKYSSNRVLSAPLPSIENGAVVEFVTDRRIERALVTGVFGWRVPLQTWVALRAIEVHVTMPRALPFSHFLENTNAKPVIRETGTERRFVLRAGPFAEIPEEMFEPSMARGSLALATLSFGTGKSWNALARSYGELVDAQIARTPMEATARAVVGDASSVREAATRIARWMRPFRYSSLNIGDGGWVPHTPGETVSRRYGDCKDLSTLIVSLLRASGWEAWPVLVSVSDEDQPGSVPSLARFDHVLVKVGGPEPFFWDPTEPDLPPGELRWDDGGRTGLVVAPSTTALEALPAGSSQRSGYEVRTELTFLEGGLGTVNEMVKAWGEAAAVEHDSRLDPAERRRRQENRLKSKYETGPLVHFEESGRDRGDIFQRTVGARQAKALQTDGDTASFSVSRLRAFASVDDELFQDESAASVSPRKHPLEFFPMAVTVRTHVIPPAGFVPRGPRAPERVELGPAFYTAEEYVLPDHSVEVVDRLDLVKSRYTPAEVSAFRQAYTELRRGNDRTVGFDSEVSRLLEAGETDRAVRRADELARASPTNPAHRGRLSRALLQSGFTERARAVARQLTRDAPDNPAGWEALGMALLVGARTSPLDPPPDVEEAVQAFRRLKSLADTLSSSFMLAVALEMGSNGERFGPGARLDEAVVELRHFRKDLRSPIGDEELLWALYRAGRDAEVLSLAPRTSSSPRRNAEWVASRAIRSGVNEALEQVRRFNLGEEERRKLLETASEELTARGEFTAAAELFARAAIGRDEESVRLRLLRLRRLRDCSDRRPALDDPRSVVRAALDPARSPSAFDAILSSSLGESVRARLREQPFHLPKDSGFDTVPDDLVGEMLWCFTEAQVTKTGEASWEARGANPWTGSPTRWVVVAERGGLKLKDADGSASTVHVSQDAVQQIWTVAARAERGPEVERFLRAPDAREKDTALPLLEAYALLSAAHGDAWKARQLLAEVVRRRNEPSLTPAEWLVLGLLAERHGLTEDARAALAKAQTGGHRDPMVTAFFRDRSVPSNST
jgi:transglutaminase-like putative cysteine protease/tetratricopeptide (TPR) repeat protein